MSAVARPCSKKEKMIISAFDQGACMAVRRRLAERNLNDWLREHLLAPHFPDLSEAPPLDVDAKWDEVFRRQHGDEISSVLAGMRHTQRTLVKFTAGHGTTTFAKALAKKGRDLSDGVFLFIDPQRRDNDLSGVEDENGLLRVLSEGLIEGLLEKNFEDLLFQGRNFYFNVLNVSEADLRAYRNLRLTGGEDKEYREWFENTTSLVAPDFLYHVGKLHSEANISTVVCFDLPHNATEAMIGKIIRSMKRIHEQKPLGFPPMALLEAYFASHEVAGAIKNMWRADFREVIIGPYSRKDIFLILETRYKPVQVGRRVPLNSILNEEFVNKAYEPGATLKEVLRKMRKNIEEACNCEPHEIGPTLALARHGGTDDSSF